ncbi:MAG: efflux RND transporter permease subunit [Myxococcota bacterium]
MKITYVAVKHGVSVYVLIFVIIIGGLVAYNGLPLESAPEIEIPIFLVTTPYIGVSPEDIESLVTRPMEKELAEINEIQVMRSTSAEGASIITVEFTADANLDEAAQEVREKVDLAKPKLPKDAQEPIIQAISTADFPMMIVNVTGTYGLIRLRKVAEGLQDKLEAIPGTMEVRLNGGLEREIQVRVDPARLNYYGVSLKQVVNAIRDENLNMPGGDVKLGDASYLVRVPGEFTEVGEIGNIIVKVRGAHAVYVRTVATVVDAYKDVGSTSRLDQRDNISLSITKRPGENIVSIADEIKAMIAAEQPKLPRGTEVVILSDMSNDIRDMVKELENTMISGMILVIAVIMLFMGFRNSVLVGVAVPLSMLVTFVVLSMLGMTLNMVVLFSLILALGMLVDNAIVIVENIYRHAGEGLGPVEAALTGTREVGWAVTTSTLTTVAVFLPLLSWPGIEGKFMSFLPKTVIITLTASLFVALIITPVMCAAFLRAARRDGGEQPSTVQAFGTAVMRRYEALLDASLHHRWRTALVVFFVFVSTFVGFGAAKLGIEFFPDVTPRKIQIAVDAGDGARFEVSNRIVRRVEDTLEQMPNIKHYVANVGSGSGQAFMTAKTSIPHKSQVSVDFLDPNERIESTLDTVEKIRNAVALFPGARIEIKKEQMGPPGGSPVEIEIYGDDIHGVGEFAKRARNEIRDVPGLVDVRDDYAVGRPEIRIEIDRERAKLMNAGTKTIAETVRTAINGTKASVFRDGDDEYDITVRLQENYRSRLSDLEDLRINVGSRENQNTRSLIPIGELATIRPGGGTGSIRHKDRKRIVTIKGNNEGRLPSEVLADVRAKLDAMERPAGIELAYAGEEERRRESQEFLMNAFLIALGLIVMVLVSQFNSVVMPTVIMGAVALSLVGVLWGQMVMQIPFGIIMTGIGVISLAGIVVNNAIVLVDYIQRLRKRGMPRHDALVRAGLVRLRPVLLTAITTILGLMPMALGVSIDVSTLSLQVGGQMADFWQPMASAVISGLLAATLLTLIVVPVLYLILDDFELSIRRLFDAGDSNAEPIDTHGGMTQP